MVIPEIELLVSGEDGVLLRRILPPGDYILGSSPDADLHVSAESVAELHTKFIVNYSEVLIEDLGSSAGTFVNGTPITDCTRLWPNQKIQIGAATVTLRRLKTPEEPGETLAPDTAAIRRLLPPEFLREAKYEIGGVVARGGMGAILDAREATTERTVAMKVMLDSNSPDDLARFVAEAKVTAQLEHPNIVPVHELSVDENEQVFYTMKFVHGITLRAVVEGLAAGAPEMLKSYPLATLLTVFQKACDAVAFAHSKGVIHRDLKPENIMLGDFGEVLVMDWGLAKVLGEQQTANVEPPNPNGRPLRALTISSRSPGDLGSTMAGSILGTPQYMAPEQARGEIEALDVRSDIYALGAILFNLLHLRPPVSGSDPMEIVRKVERGEIEWPGAQGSSLWGPRASTPQMLADKIFTRPGSGVPALHLPGGRIPDSLLAVCRKALAFDPAQRYAQVAELQADLTAYQSGFATRAEKAGAWKLLTLLVKRHRAVATATVVALALLLATSVAFTVKVLGERNRAEAALRNLRKAAPTLLAEARKLIDTQDFEDATAKLRFAVEIDPENPDYRLLLAQLLQARLELREAAEHFRRVLLVRAEPMAKANLELCEQLLRDFPTPEALGSHDALQQLYRQMGREGRATQAAPIAARLGESRKAIDAILNAKLAEWRKMPGWQRDDEGGTVQWRTGHTLLLNLGSVRWSSVPDLRGLPVVYLQLAGRNLTDLSPLRGLPLEQLNIAGTNASDLSPLEGMKLTDLCIQDTSVTTLDPLAGMPIETLVAAQCPALTDISAVRTIKRLRHASFIDSRAVQDFAPLLDCPSLESLRLPVGTKADGTSTPVNATVGSLRQHPSLHFISYGWQETKSAADFWKEFDAQDANKGVSTSAPR